MDSVRAVIDCCARWLLSFEFSVIRLLFVVGADALFGVMEVSICIRFDLFVGNIDVELFLC